MPTAEEFLFGRGLTIDDYFIERTPVSEMLCYADANGRAFDVPINDQKLRAAVMDYLSDLGVRVVELGK